MGGQGRGVAMTMWKKMWSTPGKEREFLGWPAIVFILTQLVFGLPLLPYALFRWHSADPLRFASFLAVALAASLFKVRLPGIHATMSANFLFILVVCRAETSANPISLQLGKSGALHHGCQPGLS